VEERTETTDALLDHLYCTGKNVYIYLKTCAGFTCINALSPASVVVDHDKILPSSGGKTKRGTECGDGWQHRRAPGQVGVDCYHSVLGGEMLVEEKSEKNGFCK
jgi:hypothetical protein